MGVAGALVWCVSNDTWIPFRLDAIKLSGSITKAHWESVAELIRLLASNQIVLRAGSSLSTTVDNSVPISDSVHDHTSSVLGLLKDVSIVDNPNSNQCNLNANMFEGNDDLNIPSNLHCNMLRPDKVRETVVPCTTDLLKPMTNFDNSKNVLKFKNVLPNNTKQYTITPNVKAVTFNLASNNIDNILSNLTKNKEKFVEVNASTEHGLNDIETTSKHSSLSSLDEETSLSQNGVIFVESSVLSSENDNCKVDEEQEKKKNVHEKVVETDAGKQYVPQETPCWLKLLERYHDSKRLEKQIQRQREAWARNKRNLRRESVPKCVSGLSRYVNV